MDVHQRRMRIPHLFQHGQHMALLWLQGLILHSEQLCPSLHLVNTSQPSSDLSYCVSHVSLVYIFAIADQILGTLLSLCPFLFPLDISILLPEG